MKRKSKVKESRIKDGLNRKESLILAGILALFVIISSIGFTISSLTGASISVKYYGISNEPIDTEIGKIQTAIHFDQPLLIELRDESGRAEATEVIRQISNFPKNVVNLYSIRPFIFIRATLIG